ncbi:MAG: hypothetical protein MUO40_09990 [Anaerolineaceae bacterium]|nr:hypothetical protein [Anaerolineaceae bacterium]
MSGFKTFPGEKIMFQSGGVCTFELSTTPICGEGILTTRRFVHKLSPVFNPQTYFLTPNGIDLNIPLEDVSGIRREENLLHIEHGQKQISRIQVEEAEEWLSAWLRILRTVHHKAPVEVHTDTWKFD